MVQEWSVSLFKGAEEVFRPTRRSGRGRETHLKVRERLGGLPGGLKGVRRSTQRSRWGREAHS